MDQMITPECTGSKKFTGTDLTEVKQIESVDIKLEDNVEDNWGRSNEGIFNVKHYGTGLSKFVAEEEFVFDEIKENNFFLENDNEDSKCFVKQFVDEKQAIWDRDSFLKNCFVKEEPNNDAYDNVKREKYQCQFCDHSEANKKHLREHINTIHFGNENSNSVDSEVVERKCSIDESAVGFHMVADHRHSKLRKFKCSHCDYCTTQRRRIKDHVEAIHLKLKYYCSLCDFSTNWKSCLKSHMDAIHLKTLKYKCAQCSYSANQQSTITRHMDAIHLNLRKHKCSHCDYSANRKSLLKAHFDNKHLKRENSNSTAGTERLKNHEDTINLKLKKHKCSECNYSSRTKSCLTDHMNATHLKLKKHNCPHCHLSTAWKAYLKRHIDAIHLKGKRIKVETPSEKY